MTNPSKRKGDRAELEVQGILRDHLGVGRRALGVPTSDSPPAVIASHLVDDLDEIERDLLSDLLASALSPQKEKERSA